LAEHDDRDVGGEHSVDIRDGERNEKEYRKELGGDMEYDRGANGENRGAQDGGGEAEHTAGADGREARDGGEASREHDDLERFLDGILDELEEEGEEDVGEDEELGEGDRGDMGGAREDEEEEMQDEGDARRAPRDKEGAKHKARATGPAQPRKGARASEANSSHKWLKVIGVIALIVGAALALWLFLKKRREEETEYRLYEDNLLYDYGRGY